jgi:hypothetical protein
MGGSNPLTDYLNYTLDFVGLGGDDKPKAPKPSAAPVADKDLETNKAAAAAKKKKSAIGAYGSLDTLIAGNLGSIAPQNLQYNTLLGSG